MSRSRCSFLLAIALMTVALCSRSERAAGQEVALTPMHRLNVGVLLRDIAIGREIKSSAPTTSAIGPLQAGSRKSILRCLRLSPSDMTVNDYISAAMRRT
jgi:hypothetical protein